MRCAIPGRRIGMNASYFPEQQVEDGEKTYKKTLYTWEKYQPSALNSKKT